LIVCGAFIGYGSAFGGPHLIFGILWPSWTC
jgi:hypothetical protein